MIMGMTYLFQLKNYNERPSGFQIKIIGVIMDIDILKKLAFMQYNGEEYFMEDGVYFIGNREELKSEWETYSEQSPETHGISFFDFCDGIGTDRVDTDISEDYLVLTDDEADEVAYDYIKDSVWAFNSDFIIDHTKLPYDAKDMIESYQRDRCEGANETILAMIEDFDEFVEDAISADGRGHFISSYDGYENEETVTDLDTNNKETFYIYRLN